MAKSLGGGFPIGAFWVRAPFADLLGPGTHATTFGGTPLACAVALKIFEVIERERLDENARKLGDWLKSELERLVKNYPTVLKNARGLGFMLGLEFWKGKNSRARRQRQAGFNSNDEPAAAGRRAGDSRRNAGHPAFAAAEFEAAGGGRRHRQNRGIIKSLLIRQNRARPNDGFLSIAAAETMNAAAHKHLSKRDPVLRRLIREHGKCDLTPEKRRSPFQSLVQAVAHQQLNGTAANNILSRFKNLFPGRKFPRPEDLAKVTDAQIRACGFSFAKIKSIRDIAEKSLSGVVPSSRQIVKLSDDEIIARLTEVRGVGRWTVEMLLIFQLGRPDVLPVGDFGVRTGFRLAYKKREMPEPKELLAFGEKWKPHRTTAAWFLWCAADAAKKKK